MRTRGFTVIELLVGMFVGLTIGAALVSTIYFAGRAEDSVEGENVMNSSLRQALDTMGDAIRNAQTGAALNAVQSGAISDITLYTNGSGDTVRYWLDTTVSPRVLRCRRTVAGVSQTTTVLAGVQSLTISYFVGGARYTSPSSGWTLTANPNQPTAAELPYVGAVDITATLAVRTYSRQMKTSLRIRNIPVRTRL